MMHNVVVDIYKWSKKYNAVSMMIYDAIIYKLIFYKQIKGWSGNNFKFLSNINLSCGHGANINMSSHDVEHLKRRKLFSF